MRSGIRSVRGGEGGGEPGVDTCCPAIQSGAADAGPSTTRSGAALNARPGTFELSTVVKAL
jgi:hypothetical protein